MKQKYPWLNPDNERRNMSDREILDRYIELNTSCLTDLEKQQLWICFINIKMHSV